jgi:4-hydroxybenzoate polyprenyltransferase
VWAANHLTIVKTLIYLSLCGIVVSAIFVNIRVLCLLAALSIPTLLYSALITKHNKRFRLKQISALKILLIAFTWSAVTVFVPLLQSGSDFTIREMSLIFAERFAFIFAIAIPFDIRDMKADMEAGIKTIPITFGEKNALLVCNLSLLISISVALIHYLTLDMAYIIPAYCLSAILVFIFINSKSLKHLPLYYHGLLDGSIILHGILVSLSFYLKP